MRRFLQGLGLGLLVAAIVMGINTRGNGSMADESVVEKARELGMVFPQGTKGPASESDADDNDATDKPVETDSGGARGVGVGGDDSTDDHTTASPEPTQTPDPTKKPEKTKKPAKTKKPKATPETTKNPDEPSDPNATPESHANLPDGTVVEFEVRSGLLSSSVARELYEQGIIDDMWAFDHYIEEHGLGHSIITGTYELKVGDSYEKIAKIITHTD
ncbi:MAG: hypothetical protein J5819_05905 [Eubacterium sp.]|nr:hypothetical protein [Eubacterium sp.]